MTDTSNLIRDLHARIAELEHENADLKTQRTELRDAVAALIDPDWIKLQPPVDNP